jgi:hypothetical protein
MFPSIKMFAAYVPRPSELVAMSMRKFDPWSADRQPVYGCDSCVGTLPLSRDQLPPLMSSPFDESGKSFNFFLF